MAYCVLHNFILIKEKINVDVEVEAAAHIDIQPEDGRQPPNRRAAEKRDRIMGMLV